MTDGRRDESDTGMNHLHNLRNTINGRCGVFPAPAVEEAKELAAEMWGVNIGDVEVLKI